MLVFTNKRIITFNIFRKELQTKYPPQPEQYAWLSVFDTCPVNVVPVWVFWLPGLTSIHLPENATKTSCQYELVANLLHAIKFDNIMKLNFKNKK